jgi:ketosteroid isomerase-like protein
VNTGIVSAAIQTSAVEVEVRAAFDQYESALMANDVDTMDGFFWDSSEVVRFGIADEQWGSGQVRRWRASAAPVPAGRKLDRTQVTVLSPDTTIVTTLFTYPGRDGHGRQSQTWFRVGGSWKIVNAHVSEIG